MFHDLHKRNRQGRRHHGTVPSLRAMSRDHVDDVSNVNTPLHIEGKKFTTRRKPAGQGHRGRSSFHEEAMSPHSQDDNENNERVLDTVESWNRNRSDNRSSAPEFSNSNYVDSILQKYSTGGKTMVDDILDKYRYKPSVPRQTNLPTRLDRNCGQAKSLDRMMTDFRNSSMKTRNIIDMSTGYCGDYISRNPANIVSRPFVNNTYSSSSNTPYTPSSYSVVGGVSRSKSMSQLMDASSRNDATNNCRCYGALGTTNRYCPVHVPEQKDHSGCVIKQSSLFAKPPKPDCAFPPNCCPSPPPCKLSCSVTSLPDELCSSCSSAKMPRPTKQFKRKQKKICPSAPCLAWSAEKTDKATGKTNKKKQGASNKKKKKEAQISAIEAKRIYKQNQELRIERYRLRQRLKALGKTTLWEYATLLQSLVKQCETRARLATSSPFENGSTSPDACKSPCTRICGGYTPSGHNKIKSKRALQASICCPSCPTSPPICHGFEEEEACSKGSNAITSGVVDCNQRPSRRILGEMAFQLEKRILEYVFGPERKKKNRFYGYTVSNIFYMMAKESKTAKGKTDCIAQTDKSDKMETLMCRLHKYGYKVDCHPSFSQDAINKYGVFSAIPNEETMCEYCLQDPATMNCLITKLCTSNSEQANFRVLLRCLCFMSKCDCRPLFIW